MNDDLQSYIEPELEARIVALVLGEASAFEAEEMERLMEEMPELRSYREGGWKSSRSRRRGSSGAGGRGVEALGREAGKSFFQD